MITLGHITYANCFPVHGPLLLGDVRFEGKVVAGDPGLLNRLLATGRVQVAPCSSIEYARHHPRYRLLPDLSITSRGEVRSILLASTREPEELGRCAVGFPTASASSTCLAEILLRQRYGAWPAIEWFDQSEEGPLGRFDATLFIGDVALRLRREHPDLVWTDLGSAWTRWTGLPFVYALWQVHAPPNLNGDVAACARALAESKVAGLENLEGLARRYPDPSPLPRDDLPAYWRGLEYGLGAEVRAGLALFYARAVEIGRLPRVPPLQFVRTASATSAV